MKRNRGAPLLIVLLALSVACSANRAAYLTVGATVKTVDLAMKTWADYVIAGHATREQEDQVRRLHDNYRATAQKLAVVLEAANATPTPEQISSAAAAVVGLIERFTGKRIVAGGAA